MFTVFEKIFSVCTELHVNFMIMLVFVQASPLMEHKKLVVGNQTSMSMTSYESVLLETKKSASVYTLVALLIETY